jgi:tetratricopeptide (TPR) repeat protein
MLLKILLILAIQARGGSPTRPTISTSETEDLLAIQSGAVRQSVKDGFPLYGKLIFPPGVKPTVIDVVMESFEGVIVAKTNSSPNAEFRFNNVMLGRYNIVIEGERYENVRQMLEVDTRSFGMINVEIKLKLRPGLDGEAATMPARTTVPRDAEKEFMKGLEEQRKGNAQKAVPHYEKALKIAPTYYEANVQLGVYHQKNGNPAEAARLLEQAVKSNPASLSGRLTLSRLYMQTQEFQKVIDSLRDARGGMGSAETYYLMGTAHYKLDELQDAEKDLQQALELSPETMGGAHLQLYNVYMRSRQPVKALEALDGYLARFPNAPDRQNIEERAAALRKAIKP